MPMENANVQFFSTVPVRRTKYELVVSVQIQYGMFFAKNNLKEVKKIAKSLLISGSSLAGIDTLLHMLSFTMRVILAMVPVFS